MARDNSGPRRGRDAGRSRPPKPINGPRNGSGRGRGTSHKGGTTSSGSSGGANGFVLMVAAVPLGLMALAMLSTAAYVAFG